MSRQAGALKASLSLASSDLQDQNYDIIAVTARSTALDAVVDARFGRAARFTLSDDSNGGVSYISNTEALAMLITGKGPGAHVQGLLEKVGITFHAFNGNAVSGG